MNKINKIPILLILVLGIVMVGLAIPSSATTVTTVSTPSSIKFPDSTPLQNNIKEEMVNGFFSTKDIEGSPEYNIQVLEKNETHIKLKSTTKIIFKNPRGAGYGNNRWPQFGENGIAGDDKVKNAILSDIQNITNKNERSTILAEWNKYNFE